MLRLKNYADNARHKSLPLPVEEFIRRLCLHFLPPRFVKIRHYGLLANRDRQKRLEQARAFLVAQPAATDPVPPLNASRLPTPPSLPICPHCGRPALLLVRVVPPLRLHPVAATDTS